MHRKQSYQILDSRVVMIMAILPYVIMDSNQTQSHTLLLKKREKNDVNKSGNVAVQKGDLLHSRK